MQVAKLSDINPAILIKLEKDYAAPKEIYEKLSVLYDCGVSYLDGSFTEEMVSKRAMALCSMQPDDNSRTIMLHAMMRIESKDGPIEGAVVCNRTGNESPT